MNFELRNFFEVRILSAQIFKLAIRNSKCLLALDLRFNFQLDVCGDVFEETNWNRKLAERLDVIVHVDLALLDFEAFFRQFVGYIGIRDGSVERVLLANLSAD